jgi:hypothetical protein
MLFRVASASGLTCIPFLEALHSLVFMLQKSPKTDKEEKKDK